MRVVGGMWRGREIKTPKGKDTRPTTDRTREAIASMISSACALDLSHIRALDAFAGSGALGIELLSRGAERVTFADSSRVALACVRDNLKSLGASGQPIVSGDIFKLADHPLQGAPFNLLLLDPPYAVSAQRVAELIAALSQAGSLQDDALVLYERASSAPALNLGEVGTASEQLKSKKYGSTAVDLLRISCAAVQEEEDA